jgi:hypothetical protein
MATFIAVLCVIAIVICVPLVVLKPKWVFYAFLTFVTFSTLFTGYIYEAGNLGMPRTWSPADILAWLTLAAAFFVPRERQYGSGVIGKCFIVIVLVTVFSLIQGLLMHTYTAFTYSRVAYFVAAMIFGVRYFTNYSRVNGFLKFSVVLLLVMFFLHILIRFGVFTPPSGEIEFTTQLLGERGTYSLVPLLYLTLISIAIGRLVSKVGFSLISVVLLLVGISGVVLSETRSMYGAMGVLAIASLVFIRGRIRVLVTFSLAGLIAVVVAAAIGFDPLARFRSDPMRGVGRVEAPKLFQEGTWRAIEHETIISSYREEPYFILTGRGIGAMHRVPSGELSERGFYHSEYLGWLDRSGLIGLVTVLILLFVLLVRSFALSKNDIPYMRYYGVTCFLLMIALAADGFFHPIFSNPRGASLLICFATILANWRDIYLSFYQEPEVLPEGAEQDLAYA